MIKKSGLLLLLFHFLLSCQPSIERMPDSQLPFYDLAGLVSQTIRDSLLVNVEKSIVIDGSPETKHIDNYALWKDIKEFAYYDINRPALFDKYEGDTIIDNSHSEIIYQPVDANLKVQYLRIIFENEVVQQVVIHSVFNSFLEDVTLNIDWQLGEGYQIDRSSDKLFGPTTKQVIKVSVL